MNGFSVCVHPNPFPDPRAKFRCREDRSGPACRQEQAAKVIE